MRERDGERWLHERIESFIHVITRYSTPGGVSRVFPFCFAGLARFSKLHKKQKNLQKKEIRNNFKSFAGTSESGVSSSMGIYQGKVSARSINRACGPPLISIEDTSEKGSQSVDVLYFPPFLLRQRQENLLWRTFSPINNLDQKVIAKCVLMENSFSVNYRGCSGGYRDQNDFRIISRFDTLPPTLIRILVSNH